MNFLPVQFPSKQDFSIPRYDVTVVQRSDYPYTYTSTLIPEEERPLHLHAKPGKFAGTYLQPKKTEYHIEEDTSTLTPTKTRTKVYTLAGILVQQLDTLSSMYSKEWLQDAEHDFRFQLMSFLSDDEVSSVLGKTRCRDCLYYFEKNTVKPSKSRIASLGTFLSFWMEAKIIIGETPYLWKTIPKNTENVIYMDHLDNGQWIVKNDKI
jgi:hypothetical protein